MIVQGTVAVHRWAAGFFMFLRQPPCPAPVYTDEDEDEDEDMDMTKHLHLRDLPSLTLGTPHRVTPEFKRFAIETLIEPLDLLRGYKRDEKEKAALAIISTLLLAGQRFKTVADSRDENKAGLRIPIWDALVRARYAKRCTGSEASGMVTRYYATTLLHNLFTDWTLGDTIEQHFDRESWIDPDRFKLVVIKPSKDERDDDSGEKLNNEQRWNQLKPIPPEHADWVRNEECCIDVLNRFNLKHGWSVTITDERGAQRAIQPGVTLQQQHVGEFMRWKRLYTPGSWGAQNLPKAVRRTMRIDGERTASLDFKCSMLRLWYHVADYDPDIRDLYQPDELFPKVWETTADPFARPAARNLAKKLSIISLNAPSKVVAAKALEKWLSESESPHYKAVLDSEGISTRDLVERFVRLHAMCGLFTKGKIGKTLMSLESTIMLDICMALQEFGRPVLPIHDEVVVKAIDVEFAEQVMIERYRARMGFAPVVECEIHEF